MAPLIALAGFMGSGKSSVGRALAERLGWPFIELDHEIERYLGVPIAAFFQTDGEPAFRAVEADVLCEVLKRVVATSAVLSLGGGTLQSADSLRLVKQSARVVYLDVPSDRAWARVVGSGRPLAQDEQEFRALLDERRSSYEQAADWVMSTEGRRVEDIATDLAELVRSGVPDEEALWVRRIVGAERSSLVIGGSGALEQLRMRAAAIRDSGACVHVVSDANVFNAWGEVMLETLGLERSDAWVIEAGEESKSVAELEGCWEWLAGRNARRTDVVVALGGGVVGDLAGFAAATYHRGIRLWQIPTSLVAQVDSSVGGKTAVNLKVAKNLVGAFHQPDLVVIDPATLQTLPGREYTGALGEVVKHALLSSAEALEMLERSAVQVSARDLGVVGGLIKRNVWFKASVVEEDEREAGKRACLNLGHTTAHALETVLGYGVLNHGQAVALGLLVALAASEELLALDRSVRSRTEALLKALGLETRLPLPNVGQIIAAAGHDKKAASGSTGFVGLRSIGEPVWGMDLPSDSFERALEVIAT